MRTQLALFSLALTLVACTKDVADDDSATGSDSATDSDATTDSDTGAVNELEVFVVVEDFLSGVPLEGADWTFGEQQGTTDAKGEVPLSGTSGALVEFEVRAVGYRDTHSYRPISAGTGGVRFPSIDTLAGLGQALSLPLDPGKGIVAVSVFYDDAGSEQFASGVSIDLDQSYDAALVLDASSAMGLSAGSTTLAGSGATVIFVNVPPGEVALSFSSEDFSGCELGFPSVQVTAGGYVNSRYVCAAN